MISHMEHGKEEGKDLRIQPTPRINPVPRIHSVTYSQPVRGMAAKEVIIVGSTHVVEMRGHTLFNGKQGDFLRQGTKVTVDYQMVIKSRRGPNQEWFREEDRKRKTHIYRWVHVLYVEGRDVSRENYYIREGTFRESAIMAGKQLAPSQGGIRPSIEVAPGTRHKPLLRQPKTGEEMEDDILTPEIRSLNRLARAEWVTINTGNKTPHIAMMVWKGKIYVAGNTDKALPQEQIQENVIKRLRALIDEENGGASDEIRKKRIKMYNKLKDINEGRYHGEYANNEIMRVIRAAIQKPKEFIVVLQNKQQQPRRQQKKQSPIHGEMLILDMLYDDYKTMEGRSRDERRRRMKKVFAGGNLQDCIFCHWAFDIFNQVIGRKMGIMVVSSGTHGQIPGKWRIPGWLRESEKAMEILEQKIRDLNDTDEKCRKYEIKEEEGQLVLTCDKSGQMRNTMLDASESGDEELNENETVALRK